MDYPSHLQLETSTFCNAHCSFCYLPRLERKGGVMAKDIFDKIMRDAHELRDISGLTYIGLFYLNEPLIVPQFFDYLDVLRAGSFRTVIFSNGADLTAEKAEKLAAYDDVIYIVTFSVAGVNQATCKAIMGLDYMQVKQNIEYFLAINAGRIPVSINCPNCAATRQFLSDGSWRAEWELIIPQIQYGPMYNFAGLVHDPYEIAENEYLKKQPCARIGQLCLLWDGRAHLCCMDPEGQVILGDIKEQSLLEIFNSETSVYYRRMHSERRWDELLLCKECNMHIVEKRER